MSLLALDVTGLPRTCGEDLFAYLTQRAEDVFLLTGADPGGAAGLVAVLARASGYDVIAPSPGVLFVGRGGVFDTDPAAHDDTPRATGLSRHDAIHLVLRKP